jgi:hypothetical protein
MGERILSTGLLLILGFSIFVGCENSGNTTRQSTAQSASKGKTSPEIEELKQNEIIDEAVKRAIGLVDQTPERIRKDYKMRVVDGASARTATVEFFHLEIIEGKNIDELESMMGGFPLYFWIELDRKSGVVVSEYAAAE